MRIIFEPTDSEDHYQHKISIESKNDDLSFEDAVDLVRYALLAWGYHSELVTELFEPAEGSKGGDL